MNKNQICGFLLGVGVGATLASLYAPRSGRQTRAQIARAAADGATQVKGYGESVRHSANELLERSKQEVVRQKEGITQAIKRGTEAYQEAVS